MVCEISRFENKYRYSSSICIKISLFYELIQGIARFERKWLKARFGKSIA